MYQIFRKTEATADRSSAMECRDHSKNTASLKSHTSRGSKFFGRVAITAAAVLCIVFSASAQQGTAGISPYSELTYKNGRVWENGKPVGVRRVNEAMYGNQQARELYNRGIGLNLAG